MSIQMATTPALVVWPVTLGVAFIVKISMSARTRFARWLTRTAKTIIRDTNAFVTFTLICSSLMPSAAGLSHTKSSTSLTIIDITFVSTHSPTTPG